MVKIAAGCMPLTSFEVVAVPRGEKMSGRRIKMENQRTSMRSLGLFRAQVNR